MKDTLKKIWNEYFADECAAIETDEERAIVKWAVEMHKAANELLNKEQSDIIEKYIDILYELQSSFAEKAFFKGCRFAFTFFFEIGGFGKT